MSLLLLLFSAHLLLFSTPAASDPRTTVAALICGAVSPSNSASFIQTFIPEMQSLSDSVSLRGFATSSTPSIAGNTTAAIMYGLSQCHSDLSPTDCMLCFAECRTRLLRCLPADSARIFLDGCFLRYGFSNFFNQSVDPVNDHAACGTGDSTVGGTYTENVRLMMGNLTDLAVANGGFATIERFNGADVYGLGQCWKSVNTTGCRECLVKAAKEATRCLPNNEGRGLNAGCYLRYDNYKFFGNSGGGKGLF
ncbi:Cysteine-rich receptor-like protein kinase 42 [Acorus calamus]|uniref:Cysteine-rich receptor-like protein kinase 42 n=1 Tax=Acorus calamus TaxID=4465 RepID=A0AAV9DMI6_ACOCL|nr:Cysteine-rich receptor-like protein kinase 42 [Acorus calamus]